MKTGSSIVGLRDCGGTFNQTISGEGRQQGIGEQQESVPWNPFSAGSELGGTVKISLAKNL